MGLKKYCCLVEFKYAKIAQKSCCDSTRHFDVRTIYYIVPIFVTSFVSEEKSKRTEIYELVSYNGR